MPKTRPESAPEMTQINFSDGEFAAGAKLLSCLVHPKTGPQEEQERLKIERAIGFEALKRSGKLKHWRGLQIAVPPHYISQPELERARALRKVDTELKRRRVAARIAMPLLVQFAVERPLNLEAEGRTVSLKIKALSELYQRDAGESEATNVQTRAWRPSFPVLHMAIALEILVSLARERGYPLSVFEHTLFPGFAKCMLAVAQEAATLIVQIPELQGAATQLVSFRAV
jgi:hypothetical protein